MRFSLNKPDRKLHLKRANHVGYTHCMKVSKTERGLPSDIVLFRLNGVDLADATHEITFGLSLGDVLNMISDLAELVAKIEQSNGGEQCDCN